MSMTSGRHPAAGAVDPRRALGYRRLRPADRLDPAVDQDDRAILDPPAFAVIDGGAGDRGRHAAIGPVGGRVGIGRRRGARRGLGLRRGGFGRRRPLGAAQQKRGGRRRRGPPQLHQIVLPPGLVSLSGCMPGAAGSASSLLPARSSSSRSVSRCISLFISRRDRDHHDTDANRHPADRGIDSTSPFPCSSRHARRRSPPRSCRPTKLPPRWRRTRRP